MRNGDLSSNRKYLDTAQYAARLAFAKRQYDDAMAKIGEYGVALAQQVYGPVGRMTLREAARRTQLSPTYLSQVLNGKARISPGAYGKLYRLIATS